MLSQQTSSPQALDDCFQQKAMDVIHTLLLNDSVMPMTFFCETEDGRQILILYLITEHDGMETRINAIRAIMLLHGVQRYIFASETWIPAPSTDEPTGTGNQDGLVLIHAGRSGLIRAEQYYVRRANGEISLSGRTESDSLETNTSLDALLVGPAVTEIQRQELAMIVGALPEDYPVKAYELSDDFNVARTQLSN